MPYIASSEVFDVLNWFQFGVQEANAPVNAYKVTASSIAPVNACKVTASSNAPVNTCKVTDSSKSHDHIPVSFCLCCHVFFSSQQS